MTGPSPSLSRTMGNDHARLDEAWERIRGTERAELRREWFEAYRADLVYHVEIEEREMFPRLAAAGPADALLVGRLREEHREILEVLDRIGAAIDGPIDRLGVLDVELVTLLWAHNAREETTAYPRWDELAGPDEAARIRSALDRSSSPE